jgi:hypothetical protein
MKFKIDENLPIECAKVLQESGFEADTVYDEGLNALAEFKKFQQTEFQRNFQEYVSILIMGVQETKQRRSKHEYLIDRKQLVGLFQLLENP